MKGPKQIYFLRPAGMVGPIKIGCSTQPAHRLKTLDIWSPFPLELVAQVPAINHSSERNVHWRFRDCRLHGEWFAASPALCQFIEQVARTGQLPPLEAAPYGKTKMGRGKNPNRHPEWSRAKAKITLMLWRAERHAHSYGYSRPQHIKDLVASYQGGLTPPPPPEIIAELQEHVASLLALPKASRTRDDWLRWQAERAACEAAA